MPSQQTTEALIVVDKLSEIVEKHPGDFSRDKFIESKTFLSPDGLDRVSIEFYQGIQLIVSRFRMEENGAVRVTRYCRHLKSHSLAVRRLTNEVKKTLDQHQAQRDSERRQVKLAFN